MTDNIKIILWNCRGAVGKDFYRYSKYYVDICKPEIFVLMETRCDPTKLYKPMKKLGFSQFFSVENEGYAGGIVVACRDETLKVTWCAQKEQWIHLNIQNANGVDWRFTLVYASPNDQRRVRMWEELSHIANTEKFPWIVAGDFNDIANAMEKKGGSQASSRKCSLFRDNMDKCKLNDLGSSGPKFTWRGGIYHGGQRIYERLDRAISNEEWKLLFPDSYTKVLTRVSFSDHRPIMIALSNISSVRAERNFRFKSAWLEDHNYANRVKGCWRNGEDIFNNLKRLESDAKEWNMCNIKQVQRIKRRLLARLHGIQVSMQSNNNARGLSRMESKLQQELNVILKQEELMWF
ncbi:uncharacterized protein LOC131596825 [Vicia villosa]|uniref:uncharacterized protein LOC131596825 n=1 Tax=Vicia villosa TaxID=3911 RepID=UPI00273B3484|nr:uncharacterized protein LOC131596825 [Vicia villosa]